MSECEKRFGDWRTLNQVRDAICTGLGISTTPPPPPPPAIPAYRPPTMLASPAEVTARQVVAVRPEEAPAVTPEIIVKAPAEVTITADDWREFRKLGDVNMDGVIDASDIEEMQRCWQQRVGTELWSVCARCDLNGDGIVNIKDVAVCQLNQGLTIYAWKAKKLQG